MNWKDFSTHNFPTMMSRVNSKYILEDDEKENPG